MSAIYTTSDQGAVVETLILPINPSYPHVFVAVKYFTDNTYTTLAVPLAGSIGISFKVNGSQGYAASSGTPIDCTDLGSYTSDGICAESVKATPAGISIATHYQVTVTASAT